MAFVPCWSSVASFVFLSTRLVPLLPLPLLPEWERETESGLCAFLCLPRPPSRWSSLASGIAQSMFGLGFLGRKKENKIHICLSRSGRAPIGWCFAVCFSFLSWLDATGTRQIFCDASKPKNRAKFFHIWMKCKICGFVKWKIVSVGAAS